MKVSILGHGVVGKGVWDMLQGNGDFEVCSVLVKRGEKSADFMTESFEDVLEDDSELVVECMGGVDPAFEFASKCLEAGKSFITSNKALVAAHGIDLLALALKKDKGFLFSAACGGSIPILQNLRLARKSDSIMWAGGILNGTTNYILDSMDRRHLGFDQALAEAKELGYAEFDPTADLSGMDTMRKIMLISMVAYDVLPNSDYDVEGIQNVSADDFSVANDMGCTIRLVGRCGLAHSGRLFAFVQPMICPRNDFYAGVYSNINMAQYEGKNSGVMSFMGQGAGRYPTASAVLRDMTSLREGQLHMLKPNCLVGFAYNSAKECEASYFVRFDSSFAGAFEDKVGIDKKLAQKDGNCYVITKPVTVKDMHSMAAEFRRKGAHIFFAQVKD